MHVVKSSVTLRRPDSRRGDIWRGFPSRGAKLDASQSPARPIDQDAEMEVGNVQSRIFGSTRCTLQTEDRASPKSVSRDGRLE